MNEHEYRTAPGINGSAIVEGRVSMLHMRHVMTGGEKKDTVSMAWGRKVHKAILEPDRFFGELAIWSGGRRAGGEWNDFLSRHPDPETHANVDDLAKLQAMSRNIWQDPEAAHLLRGAETEKPLFWTDERYGAAKGRVDAYNARINALVDVKTTRNIEPRRFFRSAFDLGYHLKMAWYAHGIETLTGKAPDVFVLVVEAAAPFAVWVARMREGVLKNGLDEAMSIAAQYHISERCGMFAGPTEGRVIDFELPAWATDEEDEVDVSTGEMGAGEL